MLSIILLSLLGIGATAFVIDDLTNDDDDNANTPETPGEEEPETEEPETEEPETGGPDPEPEEPTTGGPLPLPDEPETDDPTTDDPETDAPDNFNQVTGTEDAEYLDGTEEADAMDGLAGDDSMRGSDGDDIMDGGADNDRLFGNDGEDIVTGGAGNDFLRGGADDDLLLDADGADTLRGDTGDDLIFSTGVSDIDAFLAFAESGTPLADTTLDDIPGLDLTQDTDTAGDVVDGGTGDDVMVFGQGDTITGGEGIDFFVAGSPLTEGDPATITDFQVDEETLLFTYSGTTEPTVDVAVDGDDAVVSLNGEEAVRLAGVGATFSASDIDLVSLTVGDPIVGTDGEDDITGTASDELIQARAGDDVVRAGDGEDTVGGGDDNDRLFGENGDDTIGGRSGDDFARGGADDDVLFDTQGTDTLRGDTGDDILISNNVSDPNAILGSLGETATVIADGLPGFDAGATADDTGDVLDGGRGEDILFLGEGDTATGGDDADTFIGGTELLTGTAATITDFEVGVETLALTYTGDTAPALTLTTDGSDALVNLDGNAAVRITGLADTFTLDDVELVNVAA